MSDIRITVLISATPHQVWSHLSDLARHSEWMTDAAAVEFEGEQRSGTGTTLRVPTRVGPFRTVDRIEITEWIPEQRIGASHQGIVRGSGSFQLGSHDDGTLVTWSEDLRFPWYLGGRLAAFAARPVLRRIWRSNLDRFKERVETSTSR